ncbi:unnamed protein product [Chilo suppressalis]|uniref:CCHC-type domain-containing protein n=1 Tax=Chilo suppressalis TaxID=168631 RepID=A0ABN8ARN3_CHISP|nr:unnamed protein product [Chilo suppressalis]
MVSRNVSEEVGRRGRGVERGEKSEESKGTKSGDRMRERGGSKEVETKLEKNESLKIETAVNKNPLIIVKYVMGEKKKEQVEEAVRRHMIKTGQKCRKKDLQIEAIYEKKTRNLHVVLKVAPVVWRQLTEAGAFQLQWGLSCVEDQSPIIRCSRCLGFGHMKRVCQEPSDSCSHCGEDHIYVDCPKKDRAPECLNCKKAGTNNREHNTFSSECP